MGGRVAHPSASSETSVVVEKLMNISEFVAAVKPKAASSDQRPSVAAPGFALVIIRFLGKVCFLYEDAQGDGECGGVFCGQKTGLDIRTPPEWGDVRSHKTPPRSPSRWNK